MVKLINEVKKTQYDLLQSTEKDINFYTLQNIFKQSTTTLQQQFDDTNGLMKQVKVEMTEQREKHIKDIENKVQSCLSLTLSKNTDLIERNQEYLVLIENLQRCMMQTLRDLEQPTLVSNENKVEAKAAEIQNVLPQVSAAKVEEKVPFLTFTGSYDKLEESHHKLQESKQKLEKSNQELFHQMRSTEKQVEDVLKQMEVEQKEFEATIRHKTVLYEEVFQIVRNIYCLLFSV